MFKKMFGPKKIEGQGTPVPLDELRAKILEFFPREGEVNPFLTIEENKKSPDGFLAVWKFYSRERDIENNNYYKCLVTHTVRVDIDPQKNAVTLKNKHFTRSARVPRGETIYEPWHKQVKIGKLPDLIEEVEADKSRKFFKFSSKKALEPVIACITENGWDAYRGLL